MCIWRRWNIVLSFYPPICLKEYKNARKVLRFLVTGVGRFQFGFTGDELCRSGAPRDTVDTFHVSPCFRTGGDAAQEALRLRPRTHPWEKSRSLTIRRMCQLEGMRS